MPAMRISHVVRGQRPMTAEMALRLGRYFGQSPQYRLHLQSRYDLDLAEDQIGSRVVERGAEIQSRRVERRVSPLRCTSPI